MNLNLKPNSSKLNVIVFSVVGLLVSALFSFGVYVIVSVVHPSTGGFVTVPVWPLAEKSKVITPGEEVYTNLSFCKYTDAPATIGRMIVGRMDEPGNREFLAVLATVNGHFKRGCHENVYVQVGPTPKTIPPGKYRMVVTILYNLNFFTVVSHRYVTEEWVVEKPNAALELVGCRPQ